MLTQDSALAKILKALKPLWRKRFGGGGADNRQSLKGFEPVEKNEEKLSHPTKNSVKTSRSFKDFCGRILNFRRISNEGKRKIAFTLAEVLVTLSILGVVAAVTIPSIHRKWQDAYTVASVRKAYATIDSALKQMYVIEGKSSTWDWKSGATAVENNNYFATKIAKYLNVAKNCGSTTQCICKTCVFGSGSHPDIRYKNLLNQNANTYMEYYVSGRLLLKDGMILRFEIPYPECTQNVNGWSYNNFDCYIGWVSVDINGVKGPNRVGYDMFKFGIGGKGILDRNNFNQYYEFTCKDCCNKTKNEMGYSCALWILQKGNVDYKYRDVSSEW